MARASALAGVAVVVVCLTLGVRPLCAQTRVAGELGVSASQLTLNEYLPAWATTVSALFTGASSRLQFQAGGDVSRFETGHVTSYGTATGIFNLSTRPGWRGTLSADGGIGAFRGNTSGGYLRSMLRFESQHGAWGLVSFGRAGDHSEYGTGRAELGVETRRGPFTVRSSIDGGSAARVAYGNATIHTEWQSSRFVLEGETGRRLGNRFGGVRGWGAFAATVAVSERVRFAATIGTEPADPERATIGAHFVSATIRMALGRRAVFSTSIPDAPTLPNVQPALRVSAVQPDGSRILILHIAGVTGVEMMGDFTDWEPRTMTRLADGRWMLRTALPPGTHRINIRTDGGEWKAPPGVPTLPDDFGGVAGIIAVE